MIVSKFNNQSKILESKYSGEVTLAEVINNIISIKENKIYPRDLKIKADATNAIFKFSIADLKLIDLESQKFSEKYSLIIEAIIVDNPKTTVFSMLYQDSKKNDKHKIKIFSTDMIASMWLENF